MKILYASVHQVLEFDEIRIFKDLGHVVVSLGSYFGPTPAESFRPTLEFGEAERELMQVFDATGCVYSYNMPPAQQVLSEAFVDCFDVVVVMHSIDFIERHWPVISRRPVVWRTIGVNVEGDNARIAPFKSAGCKIVRYSPKEALANQYAGHDRIIRFGKNPADFQLWQGDAKQILIFSHFIVGRFASEFENVKSAVAGFPHLIGGAGNEGIPNAIGQVTYEEQLALLRSSRAYLYGTGTFITYTLNFMEAWLAGIPLVVVSGRNVAPPETFMFAEVEELVTSGVDGFIASSPNEAQNFFRQLFEDQELARSIGAAGRDRATSIFGNKVIGSQWQEFLTSIVREQPTP